MMFKDLGAEPQSKPLSENQITPLMSEIPRWQYHPERTLISREYVFSNYADALTFTLKTGQMAQAQNHHPNIHLFYNKCLVEYTTHRPAGITMNDFICAEKVDQIYALID